jgi:hypothetical protein
LKFETIIGKGNKLSSYYINYNENHENERECVKAYKTPYQNLILER